MSCFSKILQESSAYVSLRDAAATRSAPLGAIGLSPVHAAHVTHALCSDLQKRAFVVVPDEATAIRLTQDLQNFGTNACFYPQREFVFVHASGASHETEHLRTGVLGRLLSGEADCVVASVGAAAQLTVPPGVLGSRSFTLKRGDQIDPAALAGRLEACGYSRFDMVDGVCQFSVRGGIVDVFPSAAESPVRIEFWDDFVDNLFTFDPVTQRRTGEVQRLTVHPAAEVLAESPEKLIAKIEALSASLRGKAVHTARPALERDIEALQTAGRLGSYDKYLPLLYQSNGLLDYMNDGDLLICVDSARVKERLVNQNKLMLENVKGLFLTGELCKGLDRFMLTFDDYAAVCKKRSAIYLDNFARTAFDTPLGGLYTFECRQSGAWNGTLQHLKSEFYPMLHRGYTVVIAAGTKRAGAALAHDISSMGAQAHFFETQPSAFVPGAVNVLAQSFSVGFEYPALHFLAITYPKRGVSKKKSTSRSSKNAFQSLDELTRGDYIVHNVHGIGIFEGIESLEINKVKKDYIKIAYSGGDALYVPVTQLDLVSKYIGPREDTRVKINRLGSGDWQRAKKKVRASVQDMAKELTALYARRMATKGYAFSPDGDLQRDFELRFAYEETSDQIRCTEEIKKDMERPVPMDRLLCGDVGFGKTEVALRAAFKCIAEGKQCAILVPTTVLAMQHFQTATKRMEAFPVRVEMLSRFVQPKKQREVLSAVKSGEVDLLIGTHRIISKDIQFHDLGLLIIDEEQRFGVAQKEKLKERFPRVDTLTLSATPIPRTLNMAMSGIRDMSIIEEAPSDRYPVQTYVLEYDFGVCVQALEHELSRGGQAYYLHNDIATIDSLASRIKAALPQASVAVAHGRMSEEELSDVWTSLLNGETDILVCTTIIETGVDVPNVNTLIIENADRMGLAQLHQIRGRVGRSNRQAFAYLTFERGKAVSEIAAKRLDAIRDYTEFGAGFSIALRDLEIRGAGSVLGARQHGHMEAVGYDMYIKILEEEIRRQKGEEPPQEEEDCLIDLPVSAHIPESYIASTQQRLSVYKKIAAVKTQADAVDVAGELADRFGKVPGSVDGLIHVSLVRNSATKLGIYEISQKGEMVLFYFREMQTQYYLSLNQKMQGRVFLSAAKKPYISVKLGGEPVLELAAKVLEILNTVSDV